MNRRGFLTIIAAPAVVHAINLMPVRVLNRPLLLGSYDVVVDGTFDFSSHGMGSSPGALFAQLTAERRYLWAGMLYRSAMRNDVLARFMATDAFEFARTGAIPGNLHPVPLTQRG